MTVTNMVSVGTYGWWRELHPTEDTLRQAIFAKLKDTSITDLLPDGVSAVLLAGRVGTSSPSPCIALEMGSESGRTDRLPHTAATFDVYVYVRSEASSAADYTVIDPVLNAARDVLHGASLTISGVGRKTFECAWDNYRSRDHFDERKRASYRFDRYRVWLVLTDHYH